MTEMLPVNISLYQSYYLCFECVHAHVMLGVTVPTFLFLFLTLFLVFMTHDDSRRTHCP
jgi:hypothetical protein